MHLFSDRGTPASLRHMPAYSGHTYKFTREVLHLTGLPKCILWSAETSSIRQDGSFKYVKVHIKPRGGVKNFTSEEAVRIGGENPDYFIQDLSEAIDAGNYPVWNVYVQAMDPCEAENYRWNIFDMTKVWPHKDFPLRQIGKLTLNRNVR